MHHISRFLSLQFPHMATATSTSRAKNSSLASSDVKAAEALLAQVATMLPNIRVKAVFNPADGPGGPLPTLPPQGSYRNTSGRDCHDSSSRSASHYSSSFSVRPYDRQSDCGCDCDIYCDCSCEPCSCACNHKPRYYTKARPNEVYSSSVGVVASVQGSCSRGCREWYAKLDREKRVAMQAQSIHNKANNNNNTARSGDVSQQRGRAVGAVSVRVDTYSDLNAFDEDPDAPSYLVNKSVLVAEREAALLAWKKKRMEQLAEARFQREVDRQHQVQWSFSRKTAPSAADALVKRAIAHSTAANQEREARLRRKNVCFCESQHAGP